MLGRIFAGLVGQEDAWADRDYPPTDDTAAVVTRAIVPGKRTEITKIMWSYSGDPSGGSLTVSDGSTIRKHFITKGGPGALQYGVCKGSANAAVVVTLAAGGAGVTGTLDVEGVISST